MRYLPSPTLIMGNWAGQEQRFKSSATLSCRDLRSLVTICAGGWTILGAAKGSDSESSSASCPSSELPLRDSEEGGVFLLLSPPPSWAAISASISLSICTRIGAGMPYL